MSVLSQRARKFLSELSGKLNDTLFRFPLTIVTAALITVIYISVSEIFNMTAVPIQMKQLLMGLGLALPLTAAVSIGLELKNVKRVQTKIAAHAIAVAADILFVLLFIRHADRVEIYTLAFLSAAIALLAFSMPYLRDGERLTLMAVRLVSRAAVTLSLAIVVSAGIIAIVVALESLLVTDLRFNTYVYCVLGVVGFFCPVYFLSGVPKHKDELLRSGYPKVLKVIVLYIAMPFWSIFAGMLYIYMIKAIIGGGWPSGIITKLLIAFSVIGIGIFILSAPFKNVNRWVRIFNRMFFSVLAPLLLVLMFSVGLRIYEYGMTERRYIVMAVTAWLVAVALYFIIKRKSSRYFIIPLSLGMVLLLSVFGPWNMFNVSKHSQIDRLERMMEINGLLNDGELNYKANYLSVSQAEEIGALIDYISQFYDYGSIDIFKSPIQLSDLRRALGIGTNFPVPNVDDTEHYNIYNFSTTLSFDIRDYDYFIEHSFYNYPDQIEDDLLLAEFGDGTLVHMTFGDKTNPSITMQNNGQYFYSRELYEAAGKIVDLYRRKGKIQLPGQDLILVDKNKGYEVKIVFEQISCYVHKSTDKIDYDVVKFALFIKRSE